MTGLSHDTRTKSLNYKYATLSTPNFAKFCMEITAKLRDNRGFNGDNLDGGHLDKP